MDIVIEGWIVKPDLQSWILKCNLEAGWEAMGKLFGPQTSAEF